MGEAKRRRMAGDDQRTTSEQDREALDFILNHKPDNRFQSAAEKNAERFFAGEEVVLDAETRWEIDRRMSSELQPFT